MTSGRVTIILGPARSGKTRRALERYAQYLDGWRSAPTRPAGVWIAPTPAAIADIRDRLATHSQGGFLHLGVLTFAKLADEILAREGAPILPIGPLQKNRILQHIVGEFLKKERFQYFTAVAGSPGFLRQIAGTIADLKRRRLRPEEITRTSRNDRDRDIAAIYAAYDEHLAAHKLYDAESRFEAACEALGRIATRSGAQPFGLVVVDGFADFTSTQHELLKLLGVRCEELIITLPADHEGLKRDLLFDKPRRTLEILERSFPNLHQETTNECHFGSIGLELLEAALFDDTLSAPLTSRRNNAKRDGLTEGLAILAANSVDGEIREFARRIKRLLVSGHAQPDDVAVIFPSATDVADRVEEVFADFGLPLYLDCRRPLTAKALVRIITKLLQLHAEDWPFDLLLDVTGNRQIQLLNAPELPPEGIDQLAAAVERSIRRAQLPSGRTLVLEQLRQWAKAADNCELAGARQSKVRDAQTALTVLEYLERLLAPLASRAPLLNWLKETERLIQALGRDTNSEEWNLLRHGLISVHQIDLTFAPEPALLSAGEFLKIIESTARDVFLPNRTDPVGRVRVVSAEGSRNLSARHVFLAGLSEQSYSSAEGSRQLYREQEIVQFSGEETANVVERLAGETMLLFYDMVTRPWQSLTLSYPARDSKGQSLPPSPYLTELVRALAPSTISTVEMPAGSLLETMDEPLGQTDWRLAAVHTALGGDYKWLSGLVGQPTTNTLGRAVLRGISSVGSRGKRDVFGPFEGLLASEEVRRALASRFDSEHLWSPSQLERYATCPYQFYASHLLRLEPLQEIALRSDHLRRGQLLHQVLAAVHSQPIETSASATLVDRFTTALENALTRLPLQGLERALLEIERREILSWATSYAEQESAYGQQWQSYDQPLVPTYFEVRFGPKANADDDNDPVATPVPFTLDLGTEKIKLTGQIDRIDMGQINGVTVFNIIDYKTGQKVTLSDERIQAGQQLQLPLYALAAERLLLADKKAVALATGYWSVQHGGFASGRGAMLELRTYGERGLVASERWENLGPSITKRIAEIVRAIRAGEFPVYNSDPKCTERCDFSKICRIAQVRNLEKVWNSSNEMNTT